MLCIKQTQSLTRLSLPNNLIDYDLMKILYRGLMLNKTVTILDLSHNKIGRSACTKIALYLYQSKILTHLYLGDNQIHEKGLKCLGDSLKKNRSLKLLDVHLNRISDKGGQWFCEALRENNGNFVLEDVNFRGNSLASSFTLALSELLLKTGLRKIDISCNKIKNKEAQDLKDSLLKNTRQIIYIDIRNNELNDRKYLSPQTYLRKRFMK